MPKLYVSTGSDKAQPFYFEGDTIFIGRSPNNDIQITDEAVSHIHLRVRRSRNKYFVTDLCSENGTLFEGRVLDPFVEVELKEDIPMALGMTLIRLGSDCKE